MKKVLLLTSLIPFSLMAAPPAEAWINTTGVAANWNNTANWSSSSGPPSFVPNAQDQFVTFGVPAPGVANLIITQDVSPTVLLGQLSIITDNTVNNAYTISGTNSITFSVSSGSAILSTNLAANTNALTISTPVILASNLEITHTDTSKNLTLSGVISGAFSITSDQAGTVVLSGQNTFSNGLIVQAGTVQCGAATTLPASGTVSMTGGVLDLNSNAQTIAGLSGTSNITLGTATLTLTTTAANSYSGVISGGGSLSVGGTGSLTLTNNNTYSGGTTVTGGTLQLGVTNALSTSGAVNLTGGTLDLNNFNQSVTNLSGTGGSITLGTGQLTISLASGQNFAGVISGSGNVILNGNGFIWTVGAAQTYTGLTTINSGTLKFGVANALASGSPVTLTGTGILNLNNFSQTVGTLTASAGTQVQMGSGSLTIAPTADANFAGVISGTGSLTYQGPFTWTIQAAQTYTGGTIISGGTLQMGVANGLASTGAVTVNSPGILSLNNNPLAIASLSGNGDVNLGSGTLTLNTTGLATFSGPVSGTGSLVVQGSGTQVLTGSNTYSGGTTVSGSATLQGNTNSLQGAIVNNSTLFFNQTFNGTYTGPLTGVGSLLVGGGGVLTLTGNPSQGSVTVQSGELDIATGSSLAATSITVNSGATLGGSGTYAAGVFNSGTIDPAGTLTVNGNATFQSGSDFMTDLSPTTSDRLVVNGLATLQPNSQITISPQRGIYGVETRYAVITSTQPVSGTFQTVDQSNPFFKATLFYNQLLPGSVEVDLEIRPFDEVIQGGNAGAIAHCIIPQNLQRDRDLAELISSVIFLTVDQVREILEEMQPSQLRSLTVAEQTNTLFAQQTLNWRMAEFDRSTCEKEISKCYPWNFWVSLAGNWTDQRKAEHNVGYTAPAVGLTAGFDGKVAENLYLGVALEYGHTFFDWSENRGSSTINRMSGGPYLSYVGRFGYLNTSLLASFAHFDTDRHIPFFNRTATSTHHGENLLTHLDGGLAFHPAPQVTFTPFFMLDLLYGWENGFQETGAESLNFSIASSTSALFRSELGLKISKCAVRSHTKWVHDMKASWVREERYHGKDLTATFRQFPCSFTVEGLYPSRNFLDVGMGLTFIFKQDRMAATLRYEGQFGESVNIQSGIAQLLTRF